MQKRAFTYYLKPEELIMPFSVRLAIQAHYEIQFYQHGMDKMTVIVYRLEMAPTIFANIKHPVSLVRHIEEAALADAKAWWADQQAAGKKEGACL